MSREKIANILYIVCIFIVLLTSFLEIGYASTVKWGLNFLALTGVLLLLSAIHENRRKGGTIYLNSNNPITARYWSAREYGLIYAGVILFFTAFFFNSIPSRDLPGVILIVLSGIIAIIGAIASERPYGL